MQAAINAKQHEQDIQTSNINDMLGSIAKHNAQLTVKEGTIRNLQHKVSSKAKKAASARSIPAHERDARKERMVMLGELQADQNELIREHKDEVETRMMAVQAQLHQSNKLIATKTSTSTKSAKFSRHVPKPAGIPRQRKHKRQAAPSDTSSGSDVEFDTAQRRNSASTARFRTASGQSYKKRLAKVSNITPVSTRVDDHLDSFSDLNTAAGDLSMHSDDEALYDVAMY